MDSKKNLRNLILLGSAAVGTMHCVNTLIYESSKKAGHLSGTDNNYYNSRFGCISYKTCGNGTPLLLLHDLDVCSSSYEWSKVTADLSKNHTVYTIDLLGCGCSDKSNLIYTNHIYAQMIQDFIKDIIKENTDIIVTGHSAGFTLMSYTQNSTLIDKVILINPESPITMWKTYQKHSDFVKYLFAAPIIGRFIYNMCINKNKIKKQFHDKYYNNPKKVSENTIFAYYKASQKEKANGKQLYSSILCGFLNYDITKDLPKIGEKLSIIIGNSDKESIENAKKYKKYLPGITICEIENAKYLPQLESPEEFTKTIEELLEK